MIDPQDLADEIVTVLAADTAIVTAFNDDDNISAYVDDRANGITAKVSEMPWPSILVAYMGTEPGSEDANGQGREVWKHRFSIFMRPKDGVAFATVAALLVNTLLNVEFTTTASKMDTPSIRRNIDQVGDEHPEIAFTISDSNW